MRKAFLHLLLLFGPMPFAQAQSTALRYIVGESNKLYVNPGFTGYHMGLGLDRSFNERLTIGVDFSIDLLGALAHHPGKEVIVVQGDLTTTYLVDPGAMSVNYHTEYAFADNDATHVYLGTFVGLRHCTQKWTSDGYYTTSRYYPAPVDQKESQWLVPAGFRLGVRGPVDSGFLDLYTAFGYQFGGGKRVFPKIPSTVEAPYTETSSLALTIGLAYGIGW